MSAHPLNTISRRDFLKFGAGALSLAVYANGNVWAASGKAYGADSMPGGTVDDPLVFVSIAPDGKVTIVAHRAEMGTGVRTSLPMVVADELEALWANVTVVQAQANETRYGNQNVDGSRSVRHFLMPMRRVGAAARQMLEAAAAARWQVPVAEVRAIQHEVVHTPSARRLGYGELATEAAKMPVPKSHELRLKPVSEFRYMGKDDVRLVDLEAIGTGQALYGIDMHLPGMVYAVVARPAVLGGRVQRLNSEQALKIPGVLKVVEIPRFSGAPMFQPLGGVAVVARSTWAALKGREALDIEWDDGPNVSYDSQAYKQTLEAAARAPGQVVRNQGDALRVLKAAKESERHSAEYYIPHLAHATMEPLSATAQYSPQRCEVWTSVQNPQAALDLVAQAVGLEPAQVSVNVLLLGGGFGRKSKPDYVVEAALIAKAMEGTPVKLVWTREDDIHHGYLHTVSVQRLEAVVGANGMPKSWLHRSAAPTIGALFSENATEQLPIEVGMSASNMPFAIDNIRVETGPVAAHTRIGWFRSVSNIPHVFATQCFVDELAHRTGKDPKQFALDLIGPPRKINPQSLSDDWNYSESPDRYPYDTGRLRDVIEAACAGANWGRTLPKGHGLGLAFAYSFMSYSATVIEVTVNDKGDINVIGVDMAIDCGPNVKPERIRAQMEGAAIMGLSLALYGEISFDKGRVKQGNFHDYRLLRHNESPGVIRTHLVNNNFEVPPGGVGEPPLPPVAPALCNAIFAATGQRIRQLPVKLA